MEDLKKSLLTIIEGLSDDKIERVIDFAEYLKYRDSVEREIFSTKPE